MTNVGDIFINTMANYFKGWIVPVVIVVIVVWGAVIIKFIVLNNKKKKLRALADSQEPLTIQQFMNYKKNDADFVGCYVIHNLTKNMYYVGQGKNVMQRARQHFTGHGNGDVYADYKYGDKFDIRLLKLAGENIDSMEKSLINTYDAYNHGYNKNRGNRTRQG